MNNKTKSEKFRKLSITALVTSILAYLILAFSLVLSTFLSPDILSSLIWDIVIILNLGAALGLSITAVVCGSIDLKRIKAGRYSNKGRGFDITGIVGGGEFLFWLF